MAENVKNEFEPEKIVKISSTNTLEPVKKPRKRMKKLYNDIRGQMEFYMSDTNLHKNKFLPNLMKQNEEGWVELDVFTTFNKMKNICCDVPTIAKALTFSEQLIVSDDHTKIKRKYPLSTPAKDVDDRTVYVELLPLSADHEWVKKTFSPCGNIAYISLPKYKSSGDIKGFAFVEFESIESAKKAVELINNPPNLSIKTGKFPKTNKQLKQLQKIVLPENLMDADKNAITEVSSPNPSKLKRKRSNSSGGNSESDESEAKHFKTDLKTIENDEVVTSTNNSIPSKGILKQESCEEEKKAMKRKLDVYENSSEEKKVKISEKAEEISSNENKKKRRKKNKKQVKDKLKDTPPLRVISKKEWLQLRDEYLSIQKAHMSDLKESIQCQRAKVLEKEKAKLQHNEKSKNVIEFLPNVIIKVMSDEPLVQKELKAKLPPNVQQSIAYIDVQDDDKEGVIRCKTEDGAKALMDIKVPRIKFTKIEGDEEKSYWEKISSDREKKLSSKRNKKNRGTAKIMKKAEKIVFESAKKHIFFDD